MKTASKEQQESTGSEILRVENLSCIAKSSGISVVKDVSFTISRGESVGLLGESGVGKTTLFRAILQLLPNSEWRMAGEIFVGKVPVADLSPQELEKIRGRLVRCIFQEPGQSLNPSLKIDRQLVEAVKTISPDFNNKKVWKIINGALVNAGLLDSNLIRGRYPGELSGGQRQRVGIAMSLCRPCSILLADEPSNSLDSVTVTELVATLKRLKEKEYLGSLFCVTHDLSVLGAMECERVLFMNKGQMFEAGDIQNVLSNPVHKKLAEIVRLSKTIDRHGSQREEEGEKASGPTLATIKNLNFGFPKKSFFQARRPLVVKDVSFEIKKGEFIALVGSSGSGKSTIGSILARLFEDYSGKIVFDGIDIGGLRNNKAKARFHRNLQVVFQDPADTFDPALTMRQNLKECYAAMGLAKPEIEKVYKKMLELLLLEFRTLDEIPGNLSGGQKQRYALLRAFGSEPAMIIADEPFTHLDLIAQDRLIDFLLNRKKSLENPLSCLLISHEIGIVAKLCDRILVVDEGRIVESNSPYQIIRNPEHDATKRLIDAAKMLGTLAG